MDKKTKKILILGGGENQVPLIQCAKREGYYVVLCDWTSDNPGIALADKHYQVSTLDRDAVYAVAVKEQIDGVISNSEYAMTNVAYIASELGLPGNPVSGIEILTSKDRFRMLQESIGIYAPKHYVTDDRCTFFDIVRNMPLPFIVKPVECTGTRGTVKIEKPDHDLLNAVFDDCIAFSANGKLSVEEFVEMPSLHILDGDIFVCGDDIIWNGMFLSSRSSFAPMVPMTQSYPLVLDQKHDTLVRDTISRLFKAAGIRHGEYNIEMYFTKDDELFVIEINARQGGNAIPSMIEQHCGIDMCKLLITTAVNDMHYYESLKETALCCNYVSRFPVFSKNDGIYAGLYIDEAVLKHVTAVHAVKKKGDPVEKCINAMSVVAFVNLKFDSHEQQTTVCAQLEQMIYPILDDKIVISDRCIDLVSFRQFAEKGYDFFNQQLGNANMHFDAYVEKLAQKGTIVHALNAQGQILGVVVGYTHDTPDNSSYITQVYVLPEYRGRGLCGRLLKAYIEFCRAAGLKDIWLTTRVENASSRSAYEKAGFVEDPAYVNEKLVKYVIRF